MRISSVLATTIVLVGIAAQSAQGEATPWPEKPVHVIVPYPAGSPLDIRTRQLAELLGIKFGQPFIVENKAGAGGAIGTTFIAKTRPDGYTFGSAANATLAIVPNLRKDAGYDPLKDFAPVILLAKGHAVLVTNPSLPVKNVRELIAYAKANPGKLAYGSSGIGGVQHLPSELFKRMAGIDITHVPFKGESEAIPALMGGHVSMMIASITGALPHIRAGELRALAVASTKRLTILPDVPTIAESGLPGFEWHNWIGIVAPAGTPAEIISKMNSELDNLLKIRLHEEYNNYGYEIAGGPPETLTAIIRQDLQRYRRLIDELGIVAD